MYSKELSVKLLKIIDERDMTLESVAEVTGLTYRFISNITRGTQVPGLNSFEKICSALELEPNDLLISDKSKNEEKSRPMCVDTSYYNSESNICTYTPVCPRCNSLLNNVWQSYCDKCGQKLSWRKYMNSKVVMEIPNKKSI